MTKIKSFMLDKNNYAAAKTFADKYGVLVEERQKAARDERGFLIPMLFVDIPLSEVRGDHPFDVCAWTKVFEETE